MTAACREAGLADPVLEEIGTRFRVTLATVRTHAPSMDDLDQDILNALVDGEGRSTQEIAATIRRSPRATRTRLIKLIERGLVREVGTSLQDPRRRYFLAG